LGEAIMGGLKADQVATDQNQWSSRPKFNNNAQEKRAAQACKWKAAVRDIQSRKTAPTRARHPPRNWARPE
jgi:hypothetical protein